MTKIFKALEKAQGERGFRLEGAQPQCPGPLESVPATYSQTRTVDLCPDYLERMRLLCGHSDQQLVDAVNLLRTQVLQQSRANGWNAIMVTSSVAQEGKTTLALNLALSIAREAHQTALLVDTNFRNPQVANYLGLKAEAGLSDYFLHDAGIPDLLLNPAVERLVVLPAGRPITGTTEILGSMKMRSLVAELKSRYPDRYVIFDCPHVVGMPDTLVFSDYADAILMVVAQDKTKKPDITAALGLLGERPIAGLVLNKA